jgi:hypothetical protein
MQYRMTSDQRPEKPEDQKNSKPTSQPYDGGIALQSP